MEPTSPMSSSISQPASAATSVAADEIAPPSPRSSSVAGRTLPMIARISWIALRRKSVARLMSASVFPGFCRIPYAETTTGARPSWSSRAM